MEEALHDIWLKRAFAGLDAGEDVIPDKRSILRSGSDLRIGCAEKLFAEVNAMLTERGLILKQGTIVDATLIAAPSSTKNKDRSRDPEMHQAKKGNQWHFGMKAHVGVDAESGLVHTVVATAANVNDVTVAHALMRGEETDVFGEAGYQGADKRPDNQAKAILWHIAMCPGKRKALAKTAWSALVERIKTLLLDRRIEQVRRIIYLVPACKQGHKEPQQDKAGRSHRRSCTDWGQKKRPGHDLNV